MIKKITHLPAFITQIKHLDSFILKKLKKQIQKIIKNPGIGKPLKYYRSERTIYIKPYRLIYAFKDEELFLLKFEYRKSVYKNK